MNPFKRILNLSLSGLLLASCTLSTSKTALTQTVPASYYDVASEDGTSMGTVVAPDFSQLSFDSLGVFPQSGFIPSDYDHLAGYSLGRTWQAGERVADVLKLGDIEADFGVGRFTLSDIATQAGYYPTQAQLGNYGFLSRQTAAQFVRANPQLKNIPLKNIPPLRDLIAKVYGYHGRNLLEFPAGVLVDANSASAFRQFNALNRSQGVKFASLDPYSVSNSFNVPTLEISEIELGQLDLSQYTISDVEGLGESYIEEYEGWQEEALSSIEGLTGISFDQFPDPAQIHLNLISRVDWIWGYEHGLVDRTQSISGSNQVGFREPCDIECAHLELDDLENFGRSIRFFTEGDRWLVGQAPNGIICPEPPWGVKGGFGVLGQVNCGRESTGRNPFGNQFKVVLWSVDEAAETAQTALFFRFCKRGVPDLGCTPYFIGPIPFLPVSRGSWIVTGIN